MLSKTRRSFNFLHFLTFQLTSTACTAWCPILGYQRLQQSQKGTIDPSLTMENVDAFDVKLTVNTRFPTFQQSTQYNMSTTIAKLIASPLPKQGAIYFIQFTYD